MFKIKQRSFELKIASVLEQHFSGRELVYVASIVHFLNTAKTKNILTDGNGIEYTPLSYSLKQKLGSPKYYASTKKAVKAGILIPFKFVGNQGGTVEFKHCKGYNTGDRTKDGKTKYIYPALDKSGKCKHYAINPALIRNSGATRKLMTYVQTDLKKHKELNEELEKFGFDKIGYSFEYTLTEDQIQQAYRNAETTGKETAKQKASNLDIDINSQEYKNLENQRVSIEKKGLSTTLARIKNKDTSGGRRNRTNKRLDSFASNLDGSVLDMAFAGQDIVAMDLKNSQPVILKAVLEGTAVLDVIPRVFVEAIDASKYMIDKYRKSDEFKLFDRFTSTGELYESLSEMAAGATRKQIKASVFGVIFNKPNITTKERELFQECFPELLEVIDHIKRSFADYLRITRYPEMPEYLQYLIQNSANKGKHRSSRYKQWQKDDVRIRELLKEDPDNGALKFEYKQHQKDKLSYYIDPVSQGSAMFCVMLQRIESHIFIDGIARKLLKRDVDIITKHDSVMFHKKNAPEVMQSIEWHLDHYLGLGKYSLDLKDYSVLDPNILIKK